MKRYSLYIRHKRDMQWTFDRLNRVNDGHPNYRDKEANKAFDMAIQEESDSAARICLYSGDDLVRLWTSKNGEVPCR